MPPAAPVAPLPLLDPRLLLAVAAAAAPSLLGVNVSPSPTFLNQALAVGLWGAFVVLLAGQRVPGAPATVWLRAVAAPLAALALVALGVLGSWGPGALPSPLALSALGMLAAAAVLLASGAAAARRSDAAEVFALFCIGWVVAGVLNAAIGIVQIFAPSWPDGEWIAQTAISGRAGGNLRQPNHLSSLLLWSAIALVAGVELRRLGRWVAALLMALMIFAVVLTASRTGLVGVLLLALWGLFDRRLTRPTRVLLLATPLVYAASWFAMSAWAEASAAAFGGQQRLAEGDLSASRFGIWANTLALIRAHPWAGVGFGEFNFAWSLTPFPGRPVAFFDHTHNLPLQLAVELGLPLAALALALLLWGLWAAWRRAAQAGAERSVAGRCAAVMLLMIGLHSLLEYPLWYAYFLLPAAWAWGYALGLPDGAAVAPRARPAPRPAPALRVAGALVVAGAALSVADYWRVAVIFSSAEGAAPLAHRIAAGQRSVLFAHHAHYAAATIAPEPARALASFDVAAHYLLDTRLMTAWARACADAGEADKARHIAQRLREFRNPQSAPFFAECDAAGKSARVAFQCEPPSRTLGWREFLVR